MCGIIGVLAPTRTDPSTITPMRDALRSRGPDASGVIELGKTGQHVTLAHTRLKVIDPSDAGAQPMTTPDGRFTIVYNGELYNDHELREELRSLGASFVSMCDTETVLWSIATWGLDARDKLRGMYALCVHDARDDVVVLARDPMGIKPLYTCVFTDSDSNRTLAFASEARALLAHPDIEARPDPIAMDAFATSIRPEFGTRTLFDGINAYPISAWSVVRAADLETLQTAYASKSVGTDTQLPQAAADTREVIEESVLAHLRTDVPMCALLSGGLDSAIITTIAKRELGTLHTFCAGAMEQGFDDDFTHARELAASLQTDHTEVVLTQDVFLRRWVEMINERGVPLSTPNEVAIDRVTSAMHDRGFVVTLSGEGADELFGGYAQPMTSAHAFVEGSPGSDARAGAFHVLANAWIGSDQRTGVFQPSLLEHCGDGAALASWYQDVFNTIRDGSPDAFEAHRRFHERVNLPNLLRRLDCVSMSHSIEGRVPFADPWVSAHAAAIPMSSKFVPGIDGGTPKTKVCLRRAFADVLPNSIIERPKASFPVPFQKWCAPLAPLLETSGFARWCFTDDAINAVAAHPEQLWNLAWPMLNLTLWGERWWGDRTLAMRVLEGQHTLAR